MSTEAKVQEKTLPASIVISVGGAKVTAPGKLSAAKNWWYEAAQQGEITEGVSIEDALLGAEVAFDGEVLTPAKNNRGVNGEKVIAISKPRLYDKDHEKAGQPVPGTGGNQTISFFRFLPGWSDNGYSLRVTVTGIEEDGKRFAKVSLSCMDAVFGKGRIVGSVEGQIKLG